MQDVDRSYARLFSARRARALSRFALMYNAGFLVVLCCAVVALVVSGQVSTAALCALALLPAGVLTAASLRVFRASSAQVVRAEVAVAAPHDVLA